MDSRTALIYYAKHQYREQKENNQTKQAWVCNKRREQLKAALMFPYFSTGTVLADDF